MDEIYFYMFILDENDPSSRTRQKKKKKEVRKKNNSYLNKNDIFYGNYSSIQVNSCESQINQ